MIDSSGGNFVTSTLKSGGPSSSLIDNFKMNQSNAGVGTYKGVMLCNRPFAGTEGNHSNQNLYILVVKMLI